MTVDEILSGARAAGASDIHMVAGQQPMMRVQGSLQAMSYPKLGASVLLDMLIQLLTQLQREEFERTGCCLTTYQSPDGFRYRVHAYLQQGQATLSIRLIVADIPEENAIPEALLNHCKDDKGGLIILSGHPGSGKSTTLAALAKNLCAQGGRYVIGLSKAVEALIPQGSGVISQRTIGQDVSGFSQAVEEAMQLDADVLLIDALEDEDTVRKVLQAANNGMLVVAVTGASAPGMALRELAENFGVNEREEILHRLQQVLRLEIFQSLSRKEVVPQVDYRIVFATALY